MASNEPFENLTRRRARGRTLLFVLTAGCMLLATRTVSSHAELLRSDPASGSILATTPRQITLSFSEPVEAVSDSIVIEAADGTRLDAGNAAVGIDGRTLSTAIREIPAPGTFTVEWRAVSADGHPITGSFVFSVGHLDLIVAVSPGASGGSSARYLQPFGRWLHLLGLIILTGPVVILLVLGNFGDAALERRLWQFARFGAIGIFPAAAVMLLAQTVGLSGSFADGLWRAAVVDVLRTQWGTLWAIRVLLAVALVVVVHRMAGRRSGAAAAGSSTGLVLALVGVSALMLATALNGHSAATPPVVLSVAIDWLHLAATGVWAGGLLALTGSVLPWSGTLKTPRRQEMLARVVARFSNMSLVAVELLILTGLYHTWAHVSGPEALSTTAYGQTLVVKLGLIALVLVPAAVNLLIVRPQLSKPAGDAHLQSWSTRLGRLVRFEAVVAVVIVGAAAVLTSLPPAEGRVVQELSSPPAVEEQPEITFAANAGSSYVRLGISPGQVGSNRIHLSVLSGNEPITDRAPRIRIEAAPSAGVAAWTVTPARAGDGYVATVDLAPAGQWTLHVLDIASSEASFSIRIPLRGAEEILALADAAMNRLHSAVEEITVATTGAEERIEYQAPDRMRRRSEGRDEIVIGSTRYVHHSAAMWHPEASEPFRWPVSALADGARDVVLLGTETLDGQECLVVQFVDSGGVHQRIWIAPQGWRVIQQIAVSRGSTVVTRYSSFDSPVNIAPP